MIKKVLKIIVTLSALAIVGPIAMAFFIGVISGGKSNQSVENTLKDNVFTHGETGWTFKIPTGWQPQTANEAKQLSAASKMQVESATGKSLPTVAKPQGELALISGQGNMLNFKFNEIDKERFPTPEAAMDMVAQSMLVSYKKLAEPNGFKVDLKKEIKKLSQHNFRYYEVVISNPETAEVALKNRTYLSGIDGRIAMISLTCTTEEKCKQITDAVEISSFTS